MSIDQIPEMAWVWAVLCVMAILNIYNTYASARNNARSEKKIHEEPLENLRTRALENAKKLENDQRRLNEHEQRLDDIQHGMMVLCVGVQALLDHVLHDGNSDEMQVASKRIKEWLVNRL